MTVISRLRSAGFEVYTRKQWGSQRLSAYRQRASNPYYRLPMGLPNHYLHISVTSDTDTVQEGAAGARQIENYGYTSPPMVSYQMLVTNEAKIFEGQNYGVKGTHTVNDKGIAGFPKDLNREGYAVALMQNVGDEVTDEQVVAIAACFASAELEGYVRRGAPIYPHRKFAWKSCPGDKAVARLAEIERLKNKFVREGLPGQEEVSMADVNDIVKGVLTAKVPRHNGKKWVTGKNGLSLQWSIAQARENAQTARVVAERNRKAIAALGDRLEEIAPGIAEEVRQALGNEIALALEVSLADEVEAEEESTLDEAVGG